MKEEFMKSITLKLDGGKYEVTAGNPQRRGYTAQR